jgi:two-component system, sensor histidine kinase ChiS
MSLCHCCGYIDIAHLSSCICGILMQNHLLHSARFFIARATFTATLLWFSFIGVAISAPQESACPLPEASSLPQANTCLEEWQSELDSQLAGESASVALYALADKQIDASDFSGAKRVLVCATAHIKGTNDWRGQYEVIRRYGILDYKQHHIASAIGRFECALKLAKTQNDSAAIAKQLKNIGSGLRRIGDYDAALIALTESLSIQRELGDKATGGVLNNIADVYRETNRPKEAERYYLEALEVFRREKNIAESMHVYDSLGELAFNRGDIDAANKLLLIALKELGAWQACACRPFEWGHCKCVSLR